MATISFKSVGKTTSERSEQSLTSTPTPIGIATPLAIDDENILKMHTSLTDVISDNLRNLILTNHGERLVHHDFGANLQPLLTELVSQDDFDSSAVERISAAVSRWMPYVSLETFTSNVNFTANSSSNGTSVIELVITYSVPSINLLKKALNVTLYAI